MGGRIISKSEVGFTVPGASRRVVLIPREDCGLSGTGGESTVGHLGMECV